jgi:hypothetical protein
MDNSLVLKRETFRNLNSAEMTRLQGGVFTITSSAPCGVGVAVVLVTSGALSYTAAGFMAERGEIGDGHPTQGMGNGGSLAGKLTA